MYQNYIKINLMRKFFLYIFSIVLFVLFLRPAVNASIVNSDIQINPIPCSKGTNFKSICEAVSKPEIGESCAKDYADFLTDPKTKHFWVEDPVITSQGKGNERARQFIFWTLNKGAIDNHPVLTSIWGSTRNIALFMTVLISAILGIGLIVGQRMQFELKVQVWPIVYKVVGALLYITFSASIVILLIHFSELLMSFFNETLGGKDLFNIYFQGVNKETNYTSFIGCRDLNIRTHESVNTELFMLQLTNITYYVMGGMLLLRKIVLWFMLFVSPFLALLLPFMLIRNTGIIWIGVFFQWLLYGPLLALFLGATAKIWKSGIPFVFDFSRVGTPAGYVYPTAINILYGGPAQQLNNNPLINSNYVDTFAEYIITLIMLWAVIFFPWWLLRIFRDYCCDGIMAMKNILLSMYDQMRGAPTPGPTGPTNLASTALKMPQKIEIATEMKQTVHLEKIEEVKKAKTEEIARSMEISASRLTDVARLETTKSKREYVAKNISYLQNPMKAATPTERQQYMNIKSELFQRAVKEDRVAKQILSSVSTSRVEQIQKRQEIINTIGPAAPNSTQISSITASYISEVSTNSKALSYISANTKLKEEDIKKILISFDKHVDKPVGEIINAVAEETATPVEQIIAVISNMYEFTKNDKDILEKIAQKHGIKMSEVVKNIDEQIPLIFEPQKNIEKAVTIPSTISIEDYEEVKKMWKNHYEKGEVPTSATVTNRNEWIEQDIVFITNTLNKLLSSNQEVKNKGLDDLGYILPIFMINNFKGEELMVYLKAKLEAAKEVSEQSAREHELTQKLKSQEDLVKVDNKKPEAQEKEMHLEASLEIKPEEKKAF